VIDWKSLLKKSKNADHQTTSTHMRHFSEMHIHDIYTIFRTKTWKGVAFCLQKNNNSKSNANHCLKRLRKSGSTGGGKIAPLKPTKVTLFTMIFCRYKVVCRPLFHHSNVVKYASSLSQQRGCYEPWLPIITEITHPRTSLAGSAPAILQLLVYLGLVFSRRMQTSPSWRRDK